MFAHLDTCVCVCLRGAAHLHLPRLGEHFLHGCDSDVAVFWRPAGKWSHICNRAGCEMIVSHVGRVRHGHASLGGVGFIFNWICLVFSAMAGAQCQGPQCHMVGRTDQHTPGLEPLVCPCRSGSFFLFPEPGPPPQLILIYCSYHDQL